MNSLAIANILADCPSGVLALPSLWAIKCQQDSQFQSTEAKDLYLQRSVCMLEQVINTLGWRNTCGTSMQEINKLGKSIDLIYKDVRENSIDLKITTSLERFKLSNSISENCGILHSEKLDFPNTEYQGHTILLHLSVIKMEYDLENDGLLTTLEAQPSLILLQEKLIKGGFRALAISTHRASEGESNLWGVHMEGFRC